MSDIIDITQAQFNTEVMSHSGSTIVVFASDDEKSKNLVTALQDVAQETNAKLVRINYFQTGLSASLGLIKPPGIAIFKNGKVMGAQFGVPVSLLKITAHSELLRPENEGLSLEEFSEKRTNMVSGVYRNFLKYYSHASAALHTSASALLLTSGDPIAQMTGVGLLFVKAHQWAAAQNLAEYLKNKGALGTLFSSAVSPEEKKALISVHYFGLARSAFTTFAGVKLLQVAVSTPLPNEGKYIAAYAIAAGGISFARSARNLLKNTNKPNNAAPS